MTCEHQFGFKRRESGQFYCPLCRAEVFKDTDDWGVKLSDEELELIGTPKDYDWEKPLESTG